MGRKRQPLAVNGETVELDAPGLELRRRPDRTDYYWIATKEARAKNYQPVIVRLHYELTCRDEADKLAKHCRDLQAQMLGFLDDPQRKLRPTYDGTVISLIDCYERDPNSPYHALTQNTQRSYGDWCNALRTAVGSKRVDLLTGQDMRKWFLMFLQPAEPGGAYRVRLAKGCVRQMMPILLNYGAEAKLPGCLALAEVMDRITLRVPRNIRREWKASRPKKMPMTFEHAEAIVAQGLLRNEMIYQRVALGVAAQFEFTLRQIDVIGWWETHATVEMKPGMVADRGRVWKPGLCFEHFASGVLDLSTSKNDTEAAFEIVNYPLFQRALASVPEDSRQGPLVIDNDGLPLRRRRYYEIYRDLAVAAKVPPEVWNMYARHGGISEGHDAGVNPIDLMKHAQQSNLNTTAKHYVVGNVAISRRVATKRVASRPKKEIA